MGTLSSEINDLFLSRVRDYRLDSLYSSSGSFVFNQYLEPWLMDSAIEFSEVSDQDLTYNVTSGSVEGNFVLTLSAENKSIISQLMVKYWLAKSISDVLQFSNHVSDRDFKTFSAAQNLKSKQDYYNTKREELSQLLVNYSYKKNNWSQWKNQNFDGIS